MLWKTIFAKRYLTKSCDYPYLLTIIFLPSTAWLTCLQTFLKKSPIPFVSVKVARPKSFAMSLFHAAKSVLSTLLKERNNLCPVSLRKITLNLSPCTNLHPMFMSVAIILLQAFPKWRRYNFGLSPCMLRSGQWTETAVGRVHHSEQYIKANDLCIRSFIHAQHYCQYGSL